MSFNDKICLITFSNNADHQNVVYSMFRALQGKADVYTMGNINPKSNCAAYTNKNYYFNCPARPGIGKGTFRADVLLKMAGVIRKERIRYLYFESQHIWNAALMLLCPQCIKIVAVHDVIPHDGNKAMTLCNFVTSQMADHVILRNYMYKEVLSKRYRIPIKKITCFELWRDYPKQTPVVHTGVFLCFGRIRRYKGFDKLLQIVERTPNIDYRVVGEPDKESMPLVERLKQYENVCVVDHEVTDQQMVEEFKNADWLVLPYTEATQSGVITDACRFSRPSIAFNVGAISEQIADQISGFLIPEGDVDAFAKKIEELSCISTEALEGFANAAYEYGYHKYSADVAAEKFLATLEVIGENAAALS